MTGGYWENFRSASARAQWWDYSSAASYFVTICTDRFVPFFGRIENEEMIPNEIGNIVICEWNKIPAIRPKMNITLDEFQLMPDHLHGILHIGGNMFNCQEGVSMDETFEEVVFQLRHSVFGVVKKKNAFGPQVKNLSSMLGGFKSAVTSQVRIFQPAFAWQERFYDHIIRSAEELERIRVYIRNNPKNWNKKHP